VLENNANSQNDQLRHPHTNKKFSPLSDIKKISTGVVFLAKKMPMLTRQRFSGSQQGCGWIEESIAKGNIQN
jgi:hypothetical protein